MTLIYMYTNYVMFKLFQKLLWAVSEVLKSCGIDSHHKQFRSFLQQLFKVCSKQWLKQPITIVKTSTSEAMRAMAMKHKSTVLKLKWTSPKYETKIKEDVHKNKSVADVKKVLFTDNTPKTDFQFKKFDLNLNMKCSPIKNVVISKQMDDFAVFLDIKKLSPNTNHENQSNLSVSSTSDYCSKLDIDSKDSEFILAG